MDPLGIQKKIPRIGLRVPIPSPGHRIIGGPSRNLRRYKRILSKFANDDWDV